MIKSGYRYLCRLVFAQLVLVGLVGALSAYAANPIVLRFKEHLTLQDLQVIGDGAQADGKEVVRCEVKLQDQDHKPAPWGYVDWELGAMPKLEGLHIVNSSDHTDDKGKSFVELVASQPGKVPISVRFGSGETSQIQVKTKNVQFKQRPVYIDSLTAAPGASAVLGDSITVTAVVYGVDGDNAPGPVADKEVEWTAEEQDEGVMVTFDPNTSISSGEAGEQGKASTKVTADDASKEGKIRVVATVGKKSGDAHSKSMVLTFSKDAGGGSEAPGEVRIDSLVCENDCKGLSASSRNVVVTLNQAGPYTVLWDIDEKASSLENISTSNSRTPIDADGQASTGLFGAPTERGWVKVDASVEDHDSAKQSVYVHFETLKITEVKVVPSEAEIKPNGKVALQASVMDSKGTVVTTPNTVYWEIISDGTGGAHFGNEGTATATAIESGTAKVDLTVGPQAGVVTVMAGLFKDKDADGKFSCGVETVTVISGTSISKLTCDPECIDAGGTAVATITATVAAAKDDDKILWSLKPGDTEATFAVEPNAAGEYISEDGKAKVQVKADAVGIATVAAALKGVPESEQTIEVYFGGPTVTLTAHPDSVKVNKESVILAAVAAVDDQSPTVPDGSLLCWMMDDQTIGAGASLVLGDEGEPLSDGSTINRVRSSALGTVVVFAGLFEKKGTDGPVECICPSNASTSVTFIASDDD